MKTIMRRITANAITRDLSLIKWIIMESTLCKRTSTVCYLAFSLSDMPVSIVKG